jgi:hypothetical protein
MITMAPTRPSELHARRVRLTAGLAAVAEARGQVRAALRAWQAPIDADIAVLLTSDLVTHVLRHEEGATVMLIVRCTRGQLRVDVHGTSRSLLTDGQAAAETTRGLILVATLSDEWGFYRTPAGQATYFTLAFQPDSSEGPRVAGLRASPYNCTHAPGHAGQVPGSE